ncbi:GWxTD domain-containing protein [candidate division KSB1 bacterium]|nr:GWxTD domain-containing protein [candidate division KSB1 bacterium]RQW04138.1 MAG: GWxTD domain-containing protein [candidate division KSB1 bacterium]
MKTSFIIFLLISVTFAFSQNSDNAVSDTTSTVNEPEQAQFTFTADWNRFRASDSLVYLEYTAAVGRSVLTYQRQDNGAFIAELLIESSIAEGDSIIYAKNWRTRDTIENMDAHAMSMIIPIINYFVIPEGEYFLQIKMTDQFGDSRAQSIKFQIKVSPFDDGLAISDTQMATSIQRDDGESAFTKNGYKVMPNPSSVFGIGLPILYTYNEIYNFAEGTSEQGGKYTVSYHILDNDGNEVKKFADRVRSKPGVSAVAVNNLNVVTLVSGTYILEVKVTDHETENTTSTSRKFFVYRKEDFAEGGAAFQKVNEEQSGAGSPGLDASRYDAMTEEELDLEFEQAQYIAEREEARTWGKLNLEGKREYIKEYWAKRDPSPGSPANEFKDEYLGRVQLVNQLFRGAFREGWKTDRGRIMLIYGKPDEIERFPGSSDAKEYHYWHYYSIQGGVLFVFVDKRGMQDLELVHSTARGELYDPDWVRWIDPNY